MELMEKVTSGWGSKRSKGEEIELRRLALLQELLDFPGVATVLASARNAVLPVVRAETKASSIPDPGDTENMSPEETARFAAIAEEMRISTVSQESVLDEYIKEELLPKWQKGVKNFVIPGKWKARHLSMSNDRWKACLEHCGVHVNRMEFVMDARTWVGPEPRAGEFPLVLG